jgi:hypothetical protein
VDTAVWPTISKQGGEPADEPAQVDPDADVDFGDQLVVRPEGSVCFVSSTAFVDEVRSLLCPPEEPDNMGGVRVNVDPDNEPLLDVAARPADLPCSLVLDFGCVAFMDNTGLNALKAILKMLADNRQEALAHGSDDGEDEPWGCAIACVNVEVYRYLEKGGALDMLGEGDVFLTVNEAVAHLRKRKKRN